MEEDDKPHPALTRFQQFWDFIDDRDIDKHLVSVFVMIGTISLVKWSMAFAEANVSRPGLDIAAIIAAVNTPYMALQGAVINFYFKSRTTFQ